MCSLSLRCPQGHREETPMPESTTSVIVAGARTPIGRLLGGLKTQSGADLGAVAIKGALERADVAPSAVEYVIMGQVLQAGAGQVPARQAAAKAGISLDVPATSTTKGCRSAIKPIAMPDQPIRAGGHRTVGPEGGPVG